MQPLGFLPTHSPVISDWKPWLGMLPFVWRTRHHQPPCLFSFRDQRCLMEEQLYWAMQNEPIQRFVYTWREKPFRLLKPTKIDLRYHLDKLRPFGREAPSFIHQQDFQSTIRKIAKAIFTGSCLSLVLSVSCLPKSLLLMATAVQILQLLKKCFLWVVFGEFRF